MVGHSLGGGIAMVFFWQFPERVERLALVSSGGLGAEVSPLLRSASLPGVRAVLAAVADRRVTGSLNFAGTRLRERGSGLGVQLQAVARALRPLESSGARDAFAQTLRAVIDRRGQRVNANDRLYLMQDVPLLIVWGERDRTIPIEHGRSTHEALQHSRFVTLPKAAHFPHLEDPEGLAAALEAFVSETQPVVLGEATRRERLLREAHARPRPRAVA
jgi:pimeloyl-ACP methyl ester carboxylesterase